MYAVIFTAEVAELDTEYSELAGCMRDLAMSEYGCSEFISSFEDGKEIAISYWPDLEAIMAWRSNPEHMEAQLLGKKRWYKGYKVQVVEVLREYQNF